MRKATQALCQTVLTSSLQAGVFTDSSRIASKCYPTFKYQMLLDLPTLEAATLTFLVTVSRTIVESAPTILGGVFIAAYLRTQVEPERAQEVFRGEGIEGIFRAVLIGMTLPVCSIGVLPVLRELYRMGLPAGKLAAVALAAPLFNPLSLFYGLTVLSAMQLVMVVIATWAVAIALGDVCSRFTVRSQVTADTRPAALIGGPRLRNLLIAAGHFATGWMVVDLFVAIGVTALVASFLPPESLVPVFEYRHNSGPAIAALSSLFQYVSPSRGIIQLAGIGNANLSVATGLALYVFGTAISGASMLAFSRWCGVRRLGVLMLVMFLVVGAFVYLCFAVIPAPLGEVAETTVLNGMTRPSSATFTDLGEAIGESLTLMDPLANGGAVGLLVLFVAGLVVRQLKLELQTESPEADPLENTGRLSKAVPASQLGAIAALGIGLCFFLSIYVFVPAPSELLEEMDNLRRETRFAIVDRETDVAIDRIAAWDSAAASIPISAAIRWAFPSPSQRKVTRVLRFELRATRNLLKEGELVAARKNFLELMRLQSEIKKAFGGGSS